MICWTSLIFLDKAWLKNAIGLWFYIKAALMPTPKASASTSKGLKKYGNNNIDAKVRAYFSSRKNPSISSFHWKESFLVVVSMTLLWSYSAEWIFYNIMLAWGTSKFFKIWRNGSFPRHANLFCISLYSFMWNEMSKIHNFCLIETTLRLICNWLCCILSNTWRSFDHAPFLSSCISRYH